MNVDLPVRWVSKLYNLTPQQDYWSEKLIINAKLSVLIFIVFSATSWNVVLTWKQHINSSYIFIWTKVYQKRLLSTIMKQSFEFPYAIVKRYYDIVILIFY